MGNRATTVQNLIQAPIDLNIEEETRPEGLKDAKTKKKGKGKGTHDSSSSCIIVPAAFPPFGALL